MSAKLHYLIAWIILLGQDKRFFSYTIPIRTHDEVQGF